MNQEHTDDLEEKAEIARDRLIAEMWKRGHIGPITPDTNHGQLREHIEQIDDDEDREILIERYETMHDAIHHLSTRMMFERGALMQE